MTRTRYRLAARCFAASCALLVTAAVILTDLIPVGGEAASPTETVATCGPLRTDPFDLPGGPRMPADVIHAAQSRREQR